MTTSHAILIGSSLVGFSVLAHLGYTITRDRASAAAEQKVQDLNTKAASSRQRNVLSKEAWTKAVKFIDVSVSRWYESHARLQPHSTGLHSAWVKTFSLSDVKWEDDTHVIVSGMIGISLRTTPNTDQHFIWSRKVELTSDGVDTHWRLSDLNFRNATSYELKAMKSDSYFVTGVVIEGNETPLIR